MTIWATRSWSESVARVLSTQRRCAELSGSLGERDPVGAEIAGMADEVADEVAHPVATTVNAKAVQIERGVMLEYTGPLGLHLSNCGSFTSLAMPPVQQRS
jgi:hypothetical protein